MTWDVVVATVLLLGVTGLAIRHWITSAKPPPTNLRCANCPKLAVRIRMHKAGHVAWAVLLLAMFVWGAAGRMGR